MEWLTPLTALYAAAITVPLLLLMYFLKLKRQEQTISSTLLWKRAIQDMQVNAPFQKIRKNLLLLLQILTLLIILFALAGPILSLTKGPSQRYVLLLDRSGSMNTVEGDGTRLEAARKEAGLFIESLRMKTLFALQDKSDQAMVIAFDDHAQVMCNFTSDKHQLITALDSVTAGDGGSSLAEAIVVANAFAQSPGEETNNRSARNPAQLVLFSDGGIHDLDQISLNPEDMIFKCLGKISANIAITAMQARREYENPDVINIFATVANFGATQITTDVQLSINNNVHAIKSVAVPPRQSDRADEQQTPGKVSVNFSLNYTEAGILEVRQLKKDALASDDAAWSVLSPPKRLSVLLVSSGNIVLESALKACPLAKLTRCDPARFEAMDHSMMSVQQPYDVIILDNHVPAELPRGHYLVFGQPPKDIDVSVADKLENQIIIDWRSQHGIMKHVNLMNLFAAKCNKMVLPRDAEILAEFNDSPALALLRRKGSVFLLAGFDILETNWPFEPSFVLFCYNAVSFLGTQTGLSQPLDLPVGQPITVEGLKPEITAQIEGPGFSGKEIKSNPGGLIRFSGTSRAGVYSLKVPDEPVKVFAVNLLNESESNIEPQPEITLSGQPLEAQEDASARSNLPLWPYLVLAALLLACLEWLVYIGKIRL